MLSPQVFETTYEGGVKVTVNYGSDVYETEAGTPVPGRGYIIEKEGGENL